MVSAEEDSVTHEPREVRRRALRDALGLPSLILLASMTGFGSLARESGLSLGIALGATAGVWGLPGQLAFAELYAAEAGAFAIGLAVALANARFLPMAVSFLPWVRVGLTHPSRLYAIVQLLSLNSWAAGLRAFPRMAPELRRLYFVVFASVCITSGLVGTALGYFAVGALPRPVALGLIFLNPVFFAMVFAGARGRATLLALGLGAFCGPLAHLLVPDWSLLIAGVVAGSLAFWLSRPGVPRG